MIRSSMLFNEPPDDDTQPLPSPFVSRPYHLLEVRIKCGQTPQPRKMSRSDCQKRPKTVMNSSRVSKGSGRRKAEANCSIPP